MTTKETDDDFQARHDHATQVVAAILEAATGQMEQNLIVLPAKDKATGKDVSVLVVIRPAPGGGVYMAPVARIVDANSLPDELEFADGLFSEAPTMTKAELDAKVQAESVVNNHAAPATVQ